MAVYGEEVIVNVLGFNENHDDAFLESLSLLGTSDGSYRHGSMILCFHSQFNPVSRLAGGGRGLDEDRGLEGEVGE